MVLPPGRANKNGVTGDRPVVLRGATGYIPPVSPPLPGNFLSEVLSMRSTLTRRTRWLPVGLAPLALLPLVLAACAAPDSDPVHVAEQFHALRIAGDDRGIHVLLTEADRAAFPLEAFPAGLPSSAVTELLGWGDARVDSASLLSREGDTAAVLLRVEGGGRDTVRLVATHDPIRLWRYEIERVHWRVSMRLAEQAQVDSLAVLMREASGDTPGARVERAEAYLHAARLYPDMSRPADVDAATSLLRTAEVAGALRIELHMAESLRGVPFVEGRIANPTDRRVATLRLMVRDARGIEERLELWDVPAGGSTPIRQLTGLRQGPLTYQVERIQVF